MALWPLLQQSLRNLHYGACLRFQHGARSQFRLLSSLQLNPASKDTPEPVQYPKTEPNRTSEAAPSYLDLDNFAGHGKVEIWTELEGGEMRTRLGGEELRTQIGRGEVRTESGGGESRTELGGGESRTELEGGEGRTEIKEEEIEEEGPAFWDRLTGGQDRGELGGERTREKLESGQSTPGAVEIPSELTEAIQKAVAGYSSRNLRHLTRQLSEGLHDHSRGWLSDPPTSKPDPDADQEDPIHTGNQKRVDSESDSEDPIHSGKQKRIHRALSPEQEELWKDVLYPTAEKAAPKYSDGHVAAYAAARMPTTYAALVHVMQELRWQRPDFRPERVLDFGSGTGSALWAVRSVWDTWPNQAVAVEKARGMAQLGDALLTGAAGVPRVHRFRSLEALMKSRVGAHQHYDMVVAAYALGEQGGANERRRILRRLWARTKSLLVIVEAGTPRGFEIVLEAREALLTHGDKRASQRRDSQAAHVVAPCPHDGACPMSGGTQWCHFVQRLQRTSLQRVAKRAEAALRAHEDEKFSYVIIQRGPRGGRQMASDSANEEIAGAGSRSATAAEQLDSPHGIAASTWENSDVSRQGDCSAERSTENESVMVDGHLSGESSRCELAAVRKEHLQSGSSDSATVDGTDSQAGGIAETAPLGDDETDGFREEPPGTLMIDGGANDGEGTSSSAREGSKGERFGENEASNRLKNHYPREWARLISPPRQRHGHVILDLCCSGEERTGQLERRTVSKGLNGEPGSKERYSNARKAKWGSRWHWDMD